MKKNYTEPAITIETFTIEDVIITSGKLDEDELVVVPNPNT